MISFWSEIAARPVLKFCIFNGVSAALFGIGFYTNRKWNIHTTSHGLLIISILLVPLNFLAIAAFTDKSPPTDLLSLGGEGLSLVIFSVLTFLGAKTITPGNPLPATIGVMVPSLMQLLVRRFVSENSPLELIYGVGCMPVIAYVGASALALYRQKKETTLEEQAANRLFIFLGIISYSLLLPLALLLYKSGAPSVTLSQIAPLIVFCGVPSLCTGLLFLRQIVSTKLSAIQTGGISVGVLGGVIMLAAVVLAWPDTTTLLPTSIVNCLLFATLAYWFRVPQVHVASAACGTMAWLVSFHLLRADGAELGGVQLAREFLSAVSGTTLTGLALLFCVFGGAWKKMSRADDAFWWFISAASVGSLSLLLVSLFGFARVGDPFGVTWTYAIYAIGASLAAVTARNRRLTWVASGLFLATFIQGSVFRYGTHLNVSHSLAIAMLLHGTLATIAELAMTKWLKSDDSEHSDVRPALQQSAVGTTAIATGLLIVGASLIPWAATAACSLWLSCLWSVWAIRTGDGRLAASAQVALLASIFCAITMRLENYTWYTSATRPWLDPWFLQVQGIAVAVFCVGWQVIRLTWSNPTEKSARITGDENDHDEQLPQQRPIDKLLNPLVLDVRFDHICRAALVVLCVTLATYAVIPSAGQELWPLDQPDLASRVVPPATQFELRGVPHTHAAGGGGWLLLLSTATVLLIGLWERGAVWSSAGLLFVAAATCPLMASWASDDVSAASALRWLVSGFALIASAGVWLRTQLTPRLQSLGIRHGGTLASLTPSKFARAAIVILVVGTYIAMACFVSTTVLQKAGLPSTVDNILPFLVFLFLGSLISAVITFADHQPATDGEMPAIARWQNAIRIGSILLGAPLIIAMMFAVATALRQHPLVAPNSGAWFREIGWSLSYGVPLILFALTLVGYAIRDRASSFACSAGLLLNLVATMVYLIELSNTGRVLDRLAWIEVTQINCIVSALVGAIWMAGILWARGKAGGAVRVPRLLNMQLMLTIVICTMPLIAGVVGLFLFPEVPRWVAAPGQTLGWIAMLSTLAAVVIWRKVPTETVTTGTPTETSTAYATLGIAEIAGSIHHIGWILVATASILSLTVARFDTGNWLGFHTLLGCFAAAAWVMVWAQPVVTAADPLLLGAQTPTDGARRLRLHAAGNWCAVIGTVAVALGLRALEGDPAVPQWTLISLGSMGTLAIVLAWRGAKRQLMWIAGGLINFAANIAWVEYGPAGNSVFASYTEMFFVLVIAAATVCLLSIWIERSRVLPIARAHSIPAGLSFHRFATWGCIGVMFAFTGAGLLADLGGSPLGVSWILASAALIMTALATIGCFWDPASRFPVAGLYTIDLVATGMFLDSLNMSGELFEWSGTLSLAAFALASSYLWSQRSKLARLTRVWGVDEETASSNGHGWLVAANSIITVVVTFVVFRIELTFELFAHRLSASHAILASALAFACLAHGTARSVLQRSSLILGVLFAIAFGFALLPLTIESPFLHRAVVAMVAIAAMIPFYGMGIVKVWRTENEWTRAAQGLTPWLAVGATVLLVNILGLEVSQFVQQQEVDISWPALVAVAAALAGLTLFALAAAVVPGRDPMGLSERGRTSYVYCAEVLLGLLFLHIRVTMPFLFSGWFLQFWPLVVMGIAFLGVGLAEWCHRRKQHVLSEPLENTGALLPVLPVLGYWLLPSNIDYSLVLLSVGSLYFVLSMLRQSFTFAVLAVVACNGSLWFLLHSTNTLGLLQHPQLWLIPPAFCVLIAAHLNQSRLTDEQMTSTRYLSGIVIYASSTADVFVNGVGQAPWLPLVLAGLSILGIFAGILFKIRAFLFLGFAFLLVALMTIIWHAAVELEMTWIWWVSGIVTGVLIITMFGLFEKKRDEMLKLVEQVGQWKP